MKIIIRFFKKYFKRIIVLMARGILWRFRPTIIGITGSNGKTSTKFAIYAAIKELKNVRVAKENLNTPLGISATIIGNYSHLEGFFIWMRIFFKGILVLFFSLRYPKILILEYGIDRPRDMKKLVLIAKPRIAIFTSLPEVPVHIEFFEGREGVFNEKVRLFEVLPTAGFAVLNADEEIIMSTRMRTRAKVITFGFNNKADVRISNYEIKQDEAGYPLGIVFKISYGGVTLPVKLDRSLGKGHVYAVSAAVTTAIIMGENLIKVVERISDQYEPFEHRMEISRGIKDTFIIDDTYNASPLSMTEAILTLKSLNPKRRVAVLGDMLEIGEYTIEAHEIVGKEIANDLGLLITVGPRARFIAESAKRHGMSPRKIISFDTNDEVCHRIEEFIKSGDVILLKASRGIGLEKVVEDIRMPEEVFARNYKLSM